MSVEQQEVITEDQIIEDVITDEVDAPEVEEEDVITIGDEETTPQTDNKEAPEWVKDLRKKNREDQKRIKELEKQIAQKNGAQDPVKELKKPTLADCDYDDALYDQKLEEYFVAKQEVVKQEGKVKQAWEQKLETYSSKKNELKVRDFDDAEDIVKDTLNETQQGIILQGATNPALVVYALGKNEQKAKELAKISDPIQFAFEVARLETQMKITKRTPSTNPEKVVVGNERIVGGSHEKNLEKLRAKGRKSGDFSEVLAYKRKHKLN